MMLLLAMYFGSLRGLMVLTLKAGWPENYRFNGVLLTDNLDESLRIICESCNLKVRTKGKDYVLTER